MSFLKKAASGFVLFFSCFFVSQPSLAADTCSQHASEGFTCTKDCTGVTAAYSCSSGFVCCNTTTGPQGGISGNNSAMTGSSGSGQYTNMENIPGSQPTSSIVTYIENLYKFGIQITALLAVFMIGVGAFEYIVFSAGNAGKATDAKDRIFSALYGLVLAMLTYLLFFIINPDLLQGKLAGSKMQDGYMRTGAGETRTPNLARGCNDDVDASITKAANSQNLDPNILKALVKCGEGCNPNQSSAGACGYSQAMPKIRAWCGISGSAYESCTAVQSDRDKDLGCAANLVKNDFMKRCGTDINQIASCYNTGKKNNCANSQNNYCQRVANCQ